MEPVFPITAGIWPTLVHRILCYKQKFSQNYLEDFETETLKFTQKTIFHLREKSHFGNVWNVWDKRQTFIHKLTR